MKMYLNKFVFQDANTGVRGLSSFCRLRFIFLLLFTLQSTFAEELVAQTGDVVKPSALHTGRLELEAPLTACLNVLSLADDTLTPEEVFLWLSSNPGHNRSTAGVEPEEVRCIWQSFRIINSSLVDSVFYIFSRVYPSWSLYQQRGDRWMELGSAGYRKVQGFIGHVRLAIPTGDTATCLLKMETGFQPLLNDVKVISTSQFPVDGTLGFRLTSVTGKTTAYSSPHIATAQFKEMGFRPLISEIKHEKAFIFQLSLTAILLVFCLYSLLLYIQLKKVLYLSYFFYQFFIIIPFACTAWARFFNGFISSDVEVLSGFLMDVSILFYLLFVDQFLQLQKNAPAISKFLKWSRWLLGILLISSFLILIVGESGVFTVLFNFSRVISIVIGYSAIIMTFRKRIKLANYLVFGSLIYALLTNIQLAIHTFGGDGIWLLIPFVEAGVLLELICFLVGLGAYSKQEEELKNRLQEDLIESLRLNHELQQESMKVIIVTQENERARIGRDLHDDVGAQLSTLKLFIRSINGATATELPQLISKSDEILSTTIQDLRNILVNLSPKTLAESGYVAAVEELVNRIRQTSSMTFELSMHNMEKRLPMEVEESLFRITQELINNTLKYAEASQLSLDVLCVQDKIILMFEDNGKGMDLERQALGYGLSNIKARAELLDGTAYFDSTPANGFRCEIQIPMHE